MARVRSFILVLLAALSLAGCASSTSIFSDPGTNLATPNSMAVDVAGNRLYVVNSNAKVLYDWTKGSFQVYDITNPTQLVLLKSMETPSFSGLVLLDPTQPRALIPNRYSTDSSVTQDLLLNFNIDESSPNYFSFTESSLSRDPYAITCCYPADRVWVTTSYNEIQYFPLSDITAVGSIPLTTTLDNGGTISNAEVNQIEIVGSLAFLSREYGGLMVVNLDEAGVAGSVPVEYFIADVPNPRGLAYDGRYLYVVEEGTDDVDGEYHRYLLIMDISSLTPSTTNTSTRQLDKDDDHLLAFAPIEVGKTPQEVLVTSTLAFVTSQEDNVVSVIDLTVTPPTKKLDIAIGDNTEPYSLALYTDAAGVDKYLYIGNVETNTITIVGLDPADAATYLQIIASYP
jgi:hypothetical protein